MKLFPLLLLASLTACSDNEGSSASSLTQPPGQCGELETHVFGIYEAPGGEATILVNRPGRHALVVSAHEATEWTIVAGPDAIIEGVYAVGIHRQTVKAPAGTKVATDSKDDGGPSACGYTWPYDGNGCDTNQLLKMTNKITIHGATTFHGCRTATSWEMGVDLWTYADCNADTDYDMAEFVNCQGPESCGGPIIL